MVVSPFFVEEGMRSGSREYTYSENWRKWNTRTMCISQIYAPFSGFWRRKTLSKMSLTYEPYPIIFRVIYTLPHAIFVDYSWFIYRFILKYVFNTYLCKCLNTDLSDGKYTFWIFSTVWNYVSFTSNEELVISTEIDGSEVDFALEEFLTSKPSSGSTCHYYVN